VWKLLPILLLVARAASGGAPCAEVELEFIPRDGSSTTLDFERILALELESSELRMTYDGEVQEGQEPPGIELEMIETERIRFTSTYAVAGGELVEVRRHFLQLGNDFRQAITDPAGESFENESEGVSELEGVTVVFRREANGGGFHAAFADESSDMDTELLEGLEARADLSGYLPDRPVEVGDTWEVDLASFVSMTNLSGDLHVMLEGQDEEETRSYGRQFDEHLDGDIHAELVELSEEAGQRLASVRLRMELTTHIEIAKEIEDDEVSGSEEERHGFEIEVEGLLVWDVGNDHARSVDLSGRVTLEVDVSKVYGFDGHEVEIAESQSFAGTVTFELSVD
jgi:hypothetical protein